jgi:hypothetical protein
MQSHCLLRRTSFIPALVASLLGACGAEPGGTSSENDSATVLDPVTVESSACRVSYAVTETWNGGFRTDVQITNKRSTALGSWRVEWDFTRGETVVDAWNAQKSQAAAHATFVNVAYNATLGAGASTSFGFTGSGTPAAIPSNIKLNGTLCSGATPAPAPTTTTPPPAPSTAPTLSWQARYPARISFGTYRRMGELVGSDPVKANWSFVRSNVDGILLHTAYWAHPELFPDVPATAKKLAVVLADNPRIQVVMELGWPGSYEQFTVSSQLGVQKGQGAVKTLDTMRGYGIDVDVINIDWHMYLWKRLALAYPNETSTQVTERAGKFMADYVNTVLARYPNLKFRPTNSPVWFKWDAYPPLGSLDNFQRFAPLKDLNDQPVYVNGRTVNFEFNWHAILDSVYKNGPTALDGFASDTPYEYMTWGNNNPDALRYREKIRTYEGWLRSKGKRHVFIANSSNNGEATNTAAYDQNYLTRSLASMRLHQAEGGRPYEFLLESWYDGPFSITPDTQPNTMTNLVRQAIQYLKGVGQNLDLQVKATNVAAYQGAGAYQTQFGAPQQLTAALSANASATYDVLVRNAGSVACMPVLKSAEYGATGFTVKITLDGRDVTGALRSADGLVLTELVQPGATRKLQITLTRSGAASGTSRTVALYGAWNPQDPSKKIRDLVNVRASAR